MIFAKDTHVKQLLTINSKVATEASKVMLQNKTFPMLDTVPRSKLLCKFEHAMLCNILSWATCLYDNIEYIYTPSVFCYDKHKKHFDIQFSMKRHETV